MTASTLLVIYVALALLDLGWGQLLSAINYRSVTRHGDEVPKRLKASIKKEDAAKASNYSRAKMRLGFLAEPALTFVTLLAVVIGFFGFLDSWVISLGLSAYWSGALFLGALLLIQSILSTPIDLYSTFVLEKRFGFNTTTFATWLLDNLKSLGIAAALGLPLLALLYLFIDSAGSLWWLWAAAIFSLIDVVISLLYPLVIAPLFNKFSPLSEGSLKERIDALAVRCDFRVKGIFVMDGSKRSRHSNAYFTGLGRVKRIVLFDTLIQQMGEDEILAVLAHEIGHEKRKHVLKMTAVSVALSFLSFWLLSLMMRWPALYAAFGFASASKHAIILILALVSGPATFFLTPLFSRWSRTHEYQADAYSATHALASPKEGAEALASALVKLNKENASNLWPAKLYSAWYYSHPTLSERLEAIEKVGATAAEKK
jgi:Zn-dependent protease with chaperone function